MENKEVVSVLNDLIETSKDGEKGFRECAEDVKDARLKAFFTERSQQCAAAATELQALVRSLGGDPETRSSVAGTLHRGWVDLKSLITGKDDAAILNECERGEDVALKNYRQVLQKDLPPSVREVVERQAQGAQRNHDEVKSLRNIARAS